MRVGLGVTCMICGGKDGQHDADAHRHSDLAFATAGNDVYTREEVEEYWAWGETGVRVSVAGPGQTTCPHHAPCGGDCMRPAGHDGPGADKKLGDHLHLCGGGDDGVPGTCPA